MSNPVNPANPTLMDFSVHAIKESEKCPVMRDILIVMGQHMESCAMCEAIHTMLEAQVSGDTKLLLGPMLGKDV